MREQRLHCLRWRAIGKHLFINAGDYVWASYAASGTGHNIQSACTLRSRGMHSARGYYINQAHLPYNFFLINSNTAAAKMTLGCGLNVKFPKCAAGAGGVEK
jgi:hypothetical protein